MEAPVGKGVGRHVQDPHDGRRLREIEAPAASERETRRFSPRPIEGLLRPGPQCRRERLEAFRAPGPRDDERRRARALEPHDIHRELRGRERRRPKPVPGSDLLERRPVRSRDHEVRRNSHAKSLRLPPLPPGEGGVRASRVAVVQVKSRRPDQEGATAEIRALSAASRSRLS